MVLKAKLNRRIVPKKALNIPKLTAKVENPSNSNKFHKSCNPLIPNARKYINKLTR